ncbi:hypothetical protein FN846DRAFT_908926 [Sphaerosporella brunnea]|uniref:Uncharacterized protein n=1 Tax=Sphaerosporella brunnea TaxID=1250544 RepID=A0A5J5ERN6_9PEZI|nr:hypothetical protein FN846DRAFT_908926 [Sphaerosporella brunnea]
MEPTQHLTTNLMTAPHLRISIMPQRFTVDFDNETIRGLFSDDWNAIVAEVPQLPALPLNFAQSLERFDQVTTTTDFRKVITTTSYLASGDDNDKDRYFDSEWAENAIRQFLLLFEHEDQPLRSKCHENWYSVNIWSPIIDGSFLSNPGVILVRGEFTCQSSILRRNRRRSEPSLRMSHEFCVMEVATTLRSKPTSKKWLTDKAKLTRVLRDMLSWLITLADHDRRVVDKLQVVGILTAGLDMQMSRRCQRKGYVCLLVRERLRSIPNDVRQFKELLIFLARFVPTKLSHDRGLYHGIQQTIAGAFASALLDELLNDRLTSKRGTVVARLPQPADTPW